MEFLSEPTLWVALIEIAVGLALLTKAADLFVDGSARLASAARVSPVVIGAVVIGFGTSLPELLVSGLAAARGDLDFGVGNVAGSNVANLTLVLGTAGLLVPVLVTRPVVVREAPLALMSVALFAFFTLNGLTRVEGLILLAVLVAVLTWIIIGGRLPPGLDDDYAPEGGIARQGGLALAGLVGTVIGAQLLVWGALAVAARLGLDDGLVGFTLVAVGTSLPELVTAVAAARQGKTSLLLGNLLGSNMFNSLAVGGTIAAIGPGPIESRSTAVVGVGSMVLVAVLVWVFMVTRRKVGRVEAVLLLLVWFLSVAIMAGDGSADETAVWFLQ